MNPAQKRPSAVTACGFTWPAGNSQRAVSRQRQSEPMIDLLNISLGL